MEARQGRRLAWSAAIFSIATGVSRVLGLVREIVSSYYFGSRGPINAFTVAFQIPNLIRILVADAALSAAFVPVFSELLEKGERQRAWRIASIPSTVETCTMRTGTSISSASMAMRWIASASEPRVWQIAW